jgi:hypothetical protein
MNCHPVPTCDPTAPPPPHPPERKWKGKRLTQRTTCSLAPNQSPCSRIVAFSKKGSQPRLQPAHQERRASQVSPCMLGYRMPQHRVHYTGCPAAAPSRAGSQSPRSAARCCFAITEVWPHTPGPLSHSHTCVTITHRAPSSSVNSMSSRGEVAGLTVMVRYSVRPLGRDRRYASYLQRCSRQAPDWMIPTTLRISNQHPGAGQASGIFSCAIEAGHLHVALLCITDTVVSLCHLGGHADGWRPV